MQLVQFCPPLPLMPQPTGQLRRFQRERGRAGNSATCGQVIHTQGNRETFRNLQISESLSNEHLSGKERLGISPKSSRAESQKNILE